MLGLVLARYLPRRGVAALASVLLVIATVLLQGNLLGGEQRYRVFWVWTYYVVQVHVGDDPAWHTGTLPGNPFWWLLYVAALCALGVVVAVIHDPGPIASVWEGLRSAWSSPPPSSACSASRSASPTASSVPGSAGSADGDLREQSRPLVSGGPDIVADPGAGRARPMGPLGPLAAPGHRRRTARRRNGLVLRRVCSRCGGSASPRSGLAHRRTRPRRRAAGHDLDRRRDPRAEHRVLRAPLRDAGAGPLRHARVRIARTVAPEARRSRARPGHRYSSCPDHHRVGTRATSVDVTARVPLRRCPRVPKAAVRAVRAVRAHTRSGPGEWAASRVSSRPVCLTIELEVGVPDGVEPRRRLDEGEASRGGPE